MKTFFKGLVLMLFTLLQLLFGGYVLSKLWEWFVVPVFTSAPHLNYLQCIGLTFVVNFFSNGLVVALTDLKKGRDKATEKMDGTTESILKATVTVLFLYPLMLLSGFFWYWLMS